MCECLQAPGGAWGNRGFKCDYLPSSPVDETDPLSRVQCGLNLKLEVVTVLEILVSREVCMQACHFMSRVHVKTKVLVLRPSRQGSGDSNLNTQTSLTPEKWCLSRVGRREPSSLRHNPYRKYSVRFSLHHMPPILPPSSPPLPSLPSRATPPPSSLPLFLIL